MKILVGYDASRVAEEALKLAREHARVFKADIHLLTSLQQSPELQKEDIEEAESRLDKLKLDRRLLNTLSLRSDVKSRCSLAGPLDVTGALETTLCFFDSFLCFIYV